MKKLTKYETISRSKKIGENVNLKPTITIPSKQLQAVRSLPEGAFPKAMKENSETNVSRAGQRDELNVRQNSNNIYSQTPLITGRYGELLQKNKLSNSSQEEKIQGNLVGHLNKGSLDFKLPRLEANEKLHK